MHWLYLLAAVLTLAVAMTTPHAWVLALALLATVVLVGLWIRGWYLEKAGSRDELAMIDPAELRRLRELAEVRRRAAGEGRAAGDDVQPPPA